MIRGVPGLTTAVLLAFLALLPAGGGVWADTAEEQATINGGRGILIHNPLRIPAGEAWEGLVAADEMTEAQRQEKDFAVFKDPAFAIRAAGIILLGYQEKHDARSLQDIVDRWDPSADGDRAKLLETLCQRLARRPSDPIDFRDLATMRVIVEALIEYENGAQPYDRDLIEQGLRLAGVGDPGGAATNPGTGGTEPEGRVSWIARNTPGASLPGAPVDQSR